MTEPPAGLVRDAAKWIGVPDAYLDSDRLERLLLVPSFRRAVSFVAAGNPWVVWVEPRPRQVRKKFDLGEDRNGDLDIEWLADLADRCQPPD